MKDVWHIITLFLLGALGVLVVTHPKGFSQSAGTIFTGLNGWANTLSGANIKNAG